MLDTLSDLVPSVPNLLIFVAVGCAVFGVASFFEVENRLRRLTPEPARATLGPSLRRGGSSFEQLMNRWFKNRFVPSDERQRTTLKLWLLQAGYDSSRAVQTYYGFRVILGVALPTLGMVFLPLLGGQFRDQVIPAAMFLAALGFMLPTIWVSQRRKRRQREMREGLPDVLDLMLVCTEAGLGLDMAIAKVGEEATESQPLLSHDLRLITTEIRAGRSRPDAMRAFADRTGISETNSLVNLLIQSDALGTSMAQTLRVYAQDMRTRRLLKAEELAQMVTVKLSIVLVACLVPALVIAVMAPVIFNIVRTWKGLPPL